jgi:hypothetical protein
MANIRADEILPSRHAGRWQQSLWRYHLIVGQGLWAGTHANISACRDRVLLEGRIWDAPQPGVVCPRCRTIRRHHNDSNRLP